jgi:hypothetical protein
LDQAGGVLDDQLNGGLTNMTFTLLGMAEKLAEVAIETEGGANHMPPDAYNF